MRPLDFPSVRYFDIDKIVEIHSHQLLEGSFNLFRIVISLSEFRGTHKRRHNSE